MLEVQGQGRQQEQQGEKGNVPLSPAGIAALKEGLLKKRSEILSKASAREGIRRTSNAESRSGDLADQSSGNVETRVEVRLRQTDAKILQAIEGALYRIEKGTYGVCGDCGEPIAYARLEAIQWTRVCIACKRKQN